MARRGNAGGGGVADRVSQRTSVDDRRLAALVQRAGDARPAGVGAASDLRAGCIRQRRWVFAGADGDGWRAGRDDGLAPRGLGKEFAPQSEAGRQRAACCVLAQMGLSVDCLEC